jgi:glycosyltransferase involved in cell wall biosynthesis
MRKVLVVAYYFPPVGGGGVQRTLKAVKYLPTNGWQPIVLSARPPARYPQDPSLTAEIPSQTSVIRTRAFLAPGWLPWRIRHLVTRWLLLVDEQIGWLPFAVRQGQTMTQRDDISAIYTTSAPITAHLIGLRLKRLTGLPWIADWRDPWIGNFSASFATPWHEQLAARLERQIVHAADRSTVVSEPMRQALLARYPDLAPERVLTLPNGFDPSDFQGVQPLGQESGRMVIVYSGSFYGQRQSPRPFLLGLDAALATDPNQRQTLRVRFVGNTGALTMRLVEELGLDDVVKFTGYLPHRESIGHLLGADLLLVVIGDGPGSEAVFTGKIFEYLASGRPILALTPAGAAADLLVETGAATIVTPEDVPAIARQILALHQCWRTGQLHSAADPTAFARFDRRQLTARLAQTLNQISS